METKPQKEELLKLLQNQKQQTEYHFNPILGNNQVTDIPYTENRLNDISDLSLKTSNDFVYSIDTLRMLSDKERKKIRNELKDPDAIAIFDIMMKYANGIY